MIAKSTHSVFFSPSYRSIFDYIQEERQVVAKERHVTPDSVFPFKETTLREMMIKLGYAYEDSGDDRERLKQQEHVMEHRREYLMRMAKLRAQGYLIFYIDETWVNKNTSTKKSWQRDEKRKTESTPLVADGAPEVLRKGGKKAPTGKGGRAIVIGVGSRATGVVEPLLEIFRGKKSKTTDDYHKEMNAQVYEEWFAKVLDWIKDKYVSLPFPFVDCAW